MTKRTQWVITCLVFMVFWLLVSSVLWYFIFPVFMVVVSLLMILIPVGVE